VNEEQEKECKQDFERLHCGNNPWATRKNSTTGDYVLPCVQDAYAGWYTCYSVMLKGVDQ
jgi:hypothetical protein